MTGIDTTEEAGPARPARAGTTRRLRVPILVACALVGGAIGGAGGFALAAGPWQAGWQHGPRLERIQRMVRSALDSVGATTVQEDKIHDIIATSFADMGQAAEGRHAMRKQMLDLLRAPTIDRAAVEKLRGDQLAVFDARTKKMLGAILDAADQLSPEQRAKLADRIDMMAQHRREMGERWGGRHEDGMDGRPAPMNGDESQPAQPDGGPDKG